MENGYRKSQDSLANKVSVKVENTHAHTHVGQVHQVLAVCRKFTFAFVFCCSF